MMKETRRRFRSEEKVSILRRHLLDGVAVSDLCEEYEIHPTVFYRWQKAFFENGAAAFDRSDTSRARSLEREVSSLKEKLKKKDSVIAELLESHIELKKTLGET